MNFNFLKGRTEQIIDNAMDMPKYQTITLKKEKSVNEMIDEIHESFFTEVDRLLAESKISKSLDTDKQDLIDKCDRLKKLGFTNTKEVKEAEGEIERLRKLKEENDKKQTLIDAIDYYSFKYPNYKFITEESVKNICRKYNLIYGCIDRYCGSVPDNNLKKIEEFKISEDDEVYVESKEYMSMFPMRMGRIEPMIRIISKSEYEEKTKPIDYSSGERDIWITPHLSSSYRTTHFKLPLEIAAPSKDFNSEYMEVKDYKLSKIEVPDPIVLKPVIFKGQKHYLIVTAWGQEASDEIVVNPIEN